VFDNALWPTNAVTSWELPQSKGLDDFGLSIFEQTVCMHAKAFVYAGHSRLGRKVTKLSGQQYHARGTNEGANSVDDARLSGQGDVAVNSEVTTTNELAAGRRAAVQPSSNFDARKIYLPPNTSTWALVVLLFRMSVSQRDARDLANLDATFEKLLNNHRTHAATP
jgi:hypothetical protein